MPVAMQKNQDVNNPHPANLCSIVPHIMQNWPKKLTLGDDSLWPMRFAVAAIPIARRRETGGCRLPASVMMVV